MIVCADPRAQFETHREAIEAAIRRVTESGWYVLGEEVAQFEAEFSRFIGVRRAVAVGNGTDALTLGLRACGVGAGGEVITVSHTAVATVAAIELAGARPVLVDIDPATMTLDVDCLQQAITDKTRAILPVHLYGQPARMDRILDVARAHGLRVLEDCAQSAGARIGERLAGSLGDAGCFSFYPTKNLGALGDGGMLVSDDDELADQVVALRQYGWQQRYVSSFPGVNSRLDELQAAILRAKLPHLDRDNQRRQQLAAVYNEQLSGTPLTLPELAPDSSSVYHLYVVRAPQRDALRDYLGKRDIQTAIHYPLAIHQQPAYRHLASGLPATEDAVRSILSLPMYPELSLDDAGRVAQAIRDFYERSKDAP